jgi:hypothetical protein
MGLVREIAKTGWAVSGKIRHLRVSGKIYFLFFTKSCHLSMDKAYFVC